MEQTVLNTNTFTIVGRLINAEVKETSRNNVDRINVTLSIKSTIGGAEKDYEVFASASKLTRDGKVSQLYTTYAKLPELINKKIQVDGSIRASRFFSTRDQKLIDYQSLSGRWIKGVPESETDTATYELGGFVVSPLAEKKKKDGSVYKHELKIGQTDYNNQLQVITVDINPEEVNFVQGASKYLVGDTVFIKGLLDFYTVQQVSQTQGGFGDMSRTYTNHIHNYFLVGGSDPMDKSDARAYSSELIRSLIEAYKAHDVELENAAKERGSAAPAVTETPVITSRQTSLL